MLNKYRAKQKEWICESLSFMSYVFYLSVNSVYIVGYILRWFSQRRSPTPHFWGCALRRPQIRTRPRFLPNAPTPKFQFSSCYVYSFGRLTNKRTDATENIHRSSVRYDVGWWIRYHQCKTGAAVVLLQHRAAILLYRQSALVNVRLGWWLIAVWNSSSGADSEGLEPPAPNIWAMGLMQYISPFNNSELISCVWGKS